MRIKIISQSPSGRTKITQHGSVVWERDHHAVQIDGRLLFRVTDENMTKLHHGEAIVIMWCGCQNTLTKDDSYFADLKEALKPYYERQSDIAGMYFD